MKFTSIISILLAVSPSVIDGFVPSSSTFNNRGFQTSLFSKPDATAAIAAAAAASKKFGPTSPEARVAWDIVEELDAADNSAAIGGSLNDECEIDEEQLSAACVEYGEKLDQLQTLLKENEKYVQTMKGVASELKAIKLTVAKAAQSVPGGAKPSPEITAAINAAKDAETKYGKGSQEARVAWSEVEEVASSGLANAMAPVLDPATCEVESSTIEACEALEEVQRVLGQGVQA